jgi:hypothetical protein
LEKESQMTTALSFTSSSYISFFPLEVGCFFFDMEKNSSQKRKTIVIGSICKMLPMIRKASHASSWYEGNPNTLKSQLGGWLASAQVNKYVNNVKALIGPHAGYSYSGKTCAWAYKALEGRKM